MKRTSIALLLAALGGAAVADYDPYGTRAGGAAAAQPKVPSVYREYTPFLDYGSQPKAADDARHTNTWQYWKDPRKIDADRAYGATTSWTVNWKFKDPPFNDSLHGGHEAQDRGEALYRKLNATGEFARCMGAKNGDLKGLRLSYPRYDEDMKRVVGMEARIEYCSAKQGMRLENGSYDNSAVSVYIGAFSNGMPINLDVTREPLKSAFERGKQLFHMKAGWTNFSCATCHVNLAGKNLRGQTPTTHYGDAGHWPTWRGKDELQSLHVRFTECNRNAGIQPLKVGSQEYTDLEVFLTALSNGYPVVLPSTRD